MCRNFAEDQNIEIGNWVSLDSKKILICRLCAIYFNNQPKKRFVDQRKSYTNNIGRLGRETEKHETTSSGLRTGEFE